MSSAGNMSLYDNKFMDYYNYLFIDLADVRTNDWPLITSPVPGLTVLGLYLYFVNSWGPRYMANRKPFKLERLLIVYNFIQVFVSSYIFYEALAAAWLTKYSWRCQPVDPSETGMREARCCYIYFVAKMSELLDTVFFVLRKKDRQITFLHLYHHTVMPMISWGCTKYYPGGHGTFIGTINSFVHIIMYSYYLLSAMGPQFQKYLWWKKYITNMQMIQFCLSFLHSAQLIYTDCGYPRWSVFFTLPNSIFFYFLFNDFYQKAYKKSTEKKQEAIRVAAASALADAATAAAASVENASSDETCPVDEPTQNGKMSAHCRWPLDNNNCIRSIGGGDLAESKKCM